MLKVFPSKFDSLRKLTRALIREMDMIVGPENVAPINFYREVQSYEVSLILWALAHSDGKQTKAAKLLGIKPTTLNMMIKRYELNVVAKKSTTGRLSLRGTNTEPGAQVEQFVRLQ